MTPEKAMALVIRVVDFSETSTVVTLFTREFGKIRALAKGSRRPKGPFESALDLLGICRLVFLAKSSDALDLVTEAKLERRFRAAGRDLSRLYAAYYVAELLNELTDDRDPHPELFDAACETLAALGRDSGVVAALVLRFELTALRHLGHLPQLDVCVECGETLAIDGRIALGLAAGGVLCARCRPGKRNVVSLSAVSWKTLRQLAEPSAWRADPESLERPVAGELRGVMNQYVCHLLGRRPRLHAYL
jgi:DNA repair protein RecO (recombination protein O)